MNCVDNIWIKSLNEMYEMSQWNVQNESMMFEMSQWHVWNESMTCIKWVNDMYKINQWHVWN